MLVFNRSLVKVCYLLFIALMPSPANVCTFGNFGHQIVSVSLLLYTRPCGNAVWSCFSKDDGKKLQVVGTPDACLLDKADICTHQLSAAPAALNADPFICIVKFQRVMVSAGSSVFFVIVKLYRSLNHKYVGDRFVLYHQMPQEYATAIVSGEADHSPCLESRAVLTALRIKLFFNFLCCFHTRVDWKDLYQDTVQY